MHPTGTVTFLFTDIEGSTMLSQEFPDLYPDALLKHNTILQNTVESNNGLVFKIVGDSFCCAFEKASDAVRAAIDIQLKFSNVKQDKAVIKIRMGIHSGNAEWNGKDYMGYITLARSARVMSAANGGQILISQNSYNLLDKDLFIDNHTLKLRNNSQNEISFRDLGERRLKDVIQPIRLFQILCPGLKEEFPSLKTLDVRPNNLPVQLTSFIGREEEMKKVKSILAKSRLLTIIGSGGSGKTRLAMQTGADMIDDFQNGVFITELASLSENSLIVQTLMDSIGIKEEQGITPKEKLSGFLKNHETLLIFDNCEHLISECANIAEFLLINCPKLKIIATSRESLNCSGEHTYRVPSLELPESSDYDNPGILIQYEAVRLFTERALSVNSNFRINNKNASSIAEICSRLDGIPLAIELAAARSNILTADKINERLDDRFKLLSGGKRTALPRQKTLRALIDWSYDLLSDNEKILWQRVTTFTGGWTLEAAEEIVSDINIPEDEIFDLLGQLVNKSIIIFNSDKNRYSILETIRQYGNEKLKDSNLEEEFKNKHLQYFTELSVSADIKLMESEIQLWIEKLDSEHGNFQSAIAWAISEGKYEEGSKLAGNLGNFWEIRGHNSIGIKLLESLMEKSKGVSRSATAKVLLSVGILYRNLGRFEKSKISLYESLKLYREIGNNQGIVSSLNNLGIVEADRGDYKRSLEHHEEGLKIAREFGNKSGIADSLTNIGTISYHQGKYDPAQRYYEESLKLNREIGFKPGIAMCLNNLGGLASVKDNYEEAKKLFGESLSLSRQIGDKTGIGMCLNNLARFASEQGNYEQAQKLYEESLSIWRELGDKLGIVMTINNLGILEIENVNFENARNLFKESLILSIEIGDKIGLIKTLIGMSAITDKNYQICRSVKLLGAVESALVSSGLLHQLKNNEFYNRIITNFQKELSANDFAKYWEEGKKMSLEEACQLVVKS